jgi:3-methyladenine DNA glycosylase/8-oxoguanine DNA glycosylase
MPSSMSCRRVPTVKSGFAYTPRRVRELHETVDGEAEELQREAGLVAGVSPSGPYSLALSARGAGDACRCFKGGVLSALIEGEGGTEVVRAQQKPDGTITLRAESEQGLKWIRFELALDDDHSAFIERFREDPLLGPSLRVLRGLRPIRLATVAHALLRALCGQLITAREARSIEARVIRSISPRDAASGLYAPPTQEQLAALSPAELCRLGLAPKRAATLVRLCRTLDLERLRELPSDAVVARLARERTVGPWSIGVVFLEGLGRYDHGLVADLWLVKLCSVLAGRWVSEAETGEFLSRYGEWQGLASLYLLRGSSQGLVPLGRGAVDLGTSARAIRLRG